MGWAPPWIGDPRRGRGGSDRRFARCERRLGAPGRRMARVVWAIDGSGTPRRAAMDELRSAASNVARSSPERPRHRRIRWGGPRRAHPGLGAAAGLARRRAGPDPPGTPLHGADALERKSTAAAGAGPL